MEVRTHWDYHWGQSALFGSKLVPFPATLDCFPILEGPRVSGVTAAQDLLQADEAGRFLRSQHPGTAPGCLNYQGIRRNETRAENGQGCPYLPSSHQNLHFQLSPVQVQKS